MNFLSYHNIGIFNQMIGIEYLVNKLDLCKTECDMNNILERYYSADPKRTIQILDHTKYINNLIPIILSKKDTVNLLEIQSVNIMKIVQSSLQLDLILTHPIFKDDIQSLLIYLITSNIYKTHNKVFINEDDNKKLYNIWTAIQGGHKRFKYNGKLIEVNETVNWSYNPNPLEISKLLNRKSDKTSFYKKRIYLKKILDEVDNLDLDEFLDYLDTYYENSINKYNKIKKIFQHLSSMLNNS